MKKLLFVINNLELGGIQKSLTELLKVLYRKYDITVYCPNVNGVYNLEIPKSVHIIEGSSFAKIAEYDLNRLKQLGWLYFLLRAICVQWSRLLGRKIPAYLYSKHLRKEVEGSYDIAISYSQPLHSHQFAILTNEVVLFSVNAKRKVTFLHCDYKEYGGNTPYSRWLYARFDRIVAVSDSVRKRFISVHPDMDNKMTVVYNACDRDAIMNLAEDNPMLYSKPCIVSVARLSKEKGLMRCCPIVKRLKDDGFSFEWHIVGDGPERLKIESVIREYGLKESIILEGSQTNPYRFMKNAQFLFLPSLHEAAPMVFNEAACLGIGILTTNTLSARELVEQRHIGVVCDNNPDSIYNMLHNALEGKYKRILPTLSQSYNDQVVAQFEEVVHDLNI